jgi:hypothetical protein
LEEFAVNFAVNKGIAMRALALAVLGASLCTGNPPAHADGVNSAWCMIDYEGNSHCYYASSQQCLAAVASGIHGFCNVTPSASPAAAASSPRAASRRRRP